MAAYEMLSRARRGSWKSAMFGIWLKTKDGFSKERLPLLLVFQSESFTSRPKPVLLKRRLITSMIAFYSGNTGFDRVCDFKLGQLTNNVAEEIRKKFIPKMGKKWQWAAEKCYMRILMTRPLSFILLSREGNQVSYRICS